MLPPPHQFDSDSDSVVVVLRSTLGDPEGTLMGINTEGSADDDAGVIRATLIAAWFKGKVILSGIALKALTANVVSYDMA
eukprot:COSAG02_NODE_17340_length_1011_cov_1.100877_1_plen_79_part_10